MDAANEYDRENLLRGIAELAADSDRSGPFEYIEILFAWERADPAFLSELPPPPGDPDAGFGLTQEYWLFTLLAELEESGEVRSDQGTNSWWLLRFDEHVTPVREARDAALKKAETYRVARRRRVPTVDRNALDVRDGHVCRRCGTSEDLTVDHVKELIEGGDSTLDNLQWLCKSCNSRKEAARKYRLMEEFQEAW